MENGRIIIMNGVSSAGKTTLAKTLQELLSAPFYLMDVDTFVGMAPEKYHNTEGISVQHRFVSKMFHVIKLFSDMGFDMVVPFIFMNGANMLEECVTLLHAYPVLFVHVTCPAEELRRREKERGDRGIGEAETQLSLLVPQDIYDITVDTFSRSVEECTNSVIEALDSLKKCAAFKTLWEHIRSRA